MGRRVGRDGWVSDALAGMRRAAESLARGERLENHGFLIDRVVKEPPEYGPERVKALRRRMGVDQASFARIMAVSVWTVRAWERDGVSTPAMRRLLELTQRQLSAAQPRRRKAG